MATSARGLHVAQDDLRPVWCRAGRPVVFHHGIGTDHHIWDDWVPTLAARHALLRFDMRGWGASPVPPDGQDWRVEDLIEDLWEAAAPAGDGPVHLVGESFGGSLVLAAALARPERVASVHIYNASFKGRGLGELHRWRDQFAQGVAHWSERMMENRFAPGVLTPEAQEWFAATQGRTPPHVAIAIGGLLDALDLSPDLPRLAAPLSIVLPDSSPFVPVAHGEELQHLVPHATLRVVPGVRHGLPFSHARQEAALLREKLAELDGLTD